MRKSKTITAEQERELLKEAKLGKGLKKRNAIRQLIYYNTNLIKYIVTRYFTFSRVECSELISEGLRSLPKAIEKFDLKSKNKFAVYAGCWGKQYIRSYIEKTQIIKSSNNLTNSKEVVYYDENACQTSNDNNSYSLLDSLSSDSYETNQEEMRQYDIAKLINNLINSLKDSEMILFIRLFNKVAPINLFDIYKLLNEQDKKQLLIELKLDNDNEEKIKDALLKNSLSNKKIVNISLVKKHLALFTPLKQYKFSEIAKIMGKSENHLRKLKQENLAILQDLAKEKEIKPI